MDSYNIVPIESTQTIVSNKMNIRVLNLVFGVSIEVIASVIQSNGTVTQNYHLVISGEEYDNWGSDDSYMVNLIASKIGASIEPTNTNVEITTPNEPESEPQPEPEPEPEPVV
jgi:hypothetical protein